MRTASSPIWLVHACVGLLLAAGLAGCDRGYPSTEDQMRGLGLPMDSLFAVDAETDVTVRVTSGVPELIVFRDYVFGGTTMDVWPAEQPTINGGMVGWALGDAVLFGAGQGPVGEVAIDVPGARTMLVDPAVAGWAIAIPAGSEHAFAPWRIVGPDGVVLFESVGRGLPIGFEVDPTTGALVTMRDEELELLVFTPNDFGGAKTTSFRADQPTIAGGRIGSATVGSFSYLFGGGLGPIGWHVAARPVTARATTWNGSERHTWLIVVPATVAIDEIEWWVDDENGNRSLYGVGLEPSGIFVDNETDVPITINLTTANGNAVPLVIVDPGQRRLVLGPELQEPAWGSENGCTSRDLIAFDPDGTELARRAPPLCGATLDIWVVDP